MTRLKTVAATALALAAVSTPLVLQPQANVRLDREISALRAENQRLALVAGLCRNLLGIVSFVPLLFTVALIYGAVGLIGKDFDMPISVLSTLALGMAIDFAIHFVSRFRQRLAEMGFNATADGANPSALADSLLWAVARPGRGVIRNAVLFASGFFVMLFASLTPYITVGAFMVAMMLLSAVATLLYLPALVVVFGRWLPLAPKPKREPLRFFQLIQLLASPDEGFLSDFLSGGGISHLAQRQGKHRALMLAHQRFEALQVARLGRLNQRHIIRNPDGHFDYDVHRQAVIAFHNIRCPGRTERYLPAGI